MTLPRHSPALDGLRGLAILLVIASHAFPVIPELAWTVKRFTNLGFFGVQLFFVVSALTLAISWRRAAASGPPGIAAFAIRRVFRIAPAFSLAALGYAALHHAPALPATRWLTALTFTNGFSPAQMPTIPGAYVIVPGGWSIAAEFAFYAAFPALMAILRTPAACAAACLGAPLLAWAANRAASEFYVPLYGEAATGQFLYYWLPNQLPVFLLGMFVCAAAARGLPSFLSRRSGLLTAAAAAIFLALAMVSWPRLPEPAHLWLASPVIAALCFATLAAVALARPPNWVTHSALRRIGEASFSAYLLHFAVLDGMRAVLPAALLHTTGLSACIAASGVFAATVAATVLLARVTYRWIEQPFIRAGAQLARALEPARALQAAL